MESDSESSWKKFCARWLGASLVLHVVAALFSTGYYDADEHFQILEWLSARLGRSSYGGLAWEYHFRMRSWFQPMLYEALTRGLMAVGIRDPFAWATAARLLTAVVGWLSLVALIRCCETWITDRRWREWAVRLTCLFWFLPYLHARTSNESLSGSLFLMALCLYSLYPRLKLREPRALAGVGVLLGLSFACRYQMGFALAGFALWLIAVARVRDRRLLYVGGSLALTLAADLALDRWGFGQWSLTPWNYFDQTIIHGASAAVGVSPWFHYFYELSQQIPPLGALVLAGVVAGWAARPFHVLSFTSMFFVLSHCAIAHKEPRFLFPLAGMVPVIAVFGLERLRNWRFPKPLRALVAVLIVYDALVTLVVILKPSLAQIGFYREVYRHEPPITELYRLELDPYSPFGVPLAFYRPLELAEHRLGSPAELKDRLSPDRDTWFFYENFELTGPAAVLESNCKLEYTTYPSVLNHLTFLAGPRKFANRWSLFRCRL